MQLRCLTSMITLYQSFHRDSEAAVKPEQRQLKDQLIVQTKRKRLMVTS